MLDEIKDYARKKKDEADRHKWLESEKAGKDLGGKALEEWKRKHSQDFHDHWLRGKYDLP